MRSIYEAEFKQLYLLIEKNRPIIADTSEKLDNEMGSIFHLRDSRYNVYKILVETNEYLAAKAIERVAVSLFHAYGLKNYEIYPDSTKTVTKPFKIVLFEEAKRIGIIFCVRDDIGEHYDQFCRGNYDVDAIRVVRLEDPTDDAIKTHIDLHNQYNKTAYVNLEVTSIKRFWLEHFGEAEYQILIEFINDFNERVKEIIGFNTVIMPTEKALDKFRASTGDVLRTFPYTNILPTNVSVGNLEESIKYYLKTGRWRIMLTKKRYAVSFITSEWYYKMYQLTNNLDLTGIIAGYIKSVEQLLFAIFASRNIAVKDVHKNLVQFSEENMQTIYITLGSLENALSHKQWMFASNIDEDACNCVSTIVKDWNEKYRRKLFHRENLASISIVEDVRNQAILLYAVLLGGIYFRGKNLSDLGYFDK